MMAFLFYCDMSSVKCTVNDIDNELLTFAKSYLRVNDSLCIFKYPKRFDGHFVQPCEWIFEEHFAKFMDDNSIAYISEITDRCYFSPSDPVLEYLKQD